MDLLVSPRAQGLFQRTILQSPPLFDVAHDPELGGLWAEALSRGAGEWGPRVVTARSMPAERSSAT